ncbi:hypothetical protein BDR07DRAFT_1488706 [Suillus spraguei]|nr:hypothetical protein BDR07DRAFT_1488706 [Suillus spraguei]
MEHVFDADIEAEGGVQADYGEEVEVFDSAGKTWGIGQTFMDQFNWEMALFLLWSNLSMADIDKYLNLEFKDLPKGASLLGVVLSSDKTKVSNIAVRAQ